MMRRLRVVTAGAALALAAMGLFGSAAFAEYTANAGSSSATASGNTVNFGGNFQGSGGPAGDQAVTFSATGPTSNCTPSGPSSGVTDANGNFSATFTLPSSCFGNFSFTARSGRASTTSSVFVAGGKQAPGGFPNAAAALPAPGSMWAPFMAVVLAMMLVGVGGLGLAFRRR